MMNMNNDLQPSPMDVIDRAAGLQAGDRLYAARRFRATAIEHTQASHDALLFDAVEGLSVSDRLKVAIDVCQASQATDRKSTRLNSSHVSESRMPSSA